MSVLEVALLAAAAVAAGAINAVAGGGTLVTFPTLILCQTPPLVANATSAFALLVGTAGSMYGFRSHIGKVKPILTRLIPISLVGGLIGGVLLTMTDEKVFSRLVPFLILLATLLFAFKGYFKKMTTEEHVPAHFTTLSALLFQFFVAIYGGYFGAGIGILMLATFAWFGLHNIHEMNALKTVVSALINLVACLWFIYSGLIDWPKALIMTGGALVGYFLGSHYSQKVAPEIISRGVVGIGFLISGIMFYREFIR